MKNNLDAVIDRLGDMNPAKYKAFILKNLDSRTWIKLKG
jgi:hypothetical protein